MTSNHKSCMRSLIVAGVLFATCGGSESQTVFTPSFQVLVPPASFGNTVYGDAISADGSTVVAQWFLPGSDPNCGIPGGCSRALRWTAVGGFQDLGLGGGVEAEPSDVSADGAQVVASVGSRIAFRRAMIWTASTGFVDVGTPYFPSADPAYSVSYGFGISGSGSVIVGNAIPTTSSLIPHSMSLTVSGTSTAFSMIAQLANELQGQANGVSDDGKVIVGLSYDSSFNQRAYRWQSGSVTDLGNLGAQSAQAFATNSDGSVVVGQSNTSGCGSACPDAFRWTASGSMKDMGNLQKGGMYLGDVSADGSVVVGSGANGGGGLTHAWRWTSRNGLEDLNKVLSNLGVSTNGYTLIFATAISADGTTIVGTAENSTSLFPYIAVIPPPTCAPITCAALGKNCGSLSDGCGGTLNCGTCGGSQTCGGGGKANVCGPCLPTTCADQGKTCGGIPDGCGSWLNCGTCSGTQTCGGAGTANVCGTPPPFPTNLTFNPNPVVGGNNTIGTVTLSSPAPSGGAVVTLSCSNTAVNTCPASVTVPSGQTSASFTATTSPPAQDTVSMNAACLNGQCYNTTLFISTACVPAVCMTGNCGTMGDGCGGTLNCGSCGSGQTCTNNTCTLPCTPNTCASLGKNCGTVGDGCGGTLSCGTCGSGQTCTNNVCVSGGSVTLSSLIVSPTSVSGGNDSQGTVTLTATASANTTVNLSSSNSSVASVPSTVTVAAGSKSATFTIKTNRVSNSTSVTITASQGGVTKTATLTVTAGGRN